MEAFAARTSLGPYLADQFAIVTRQTAVAVGKSHSAGVADKVTDSLELVDWPFLPYQFGFEPLDSFGSW